MNDQNKIGEETSARSYVQFIEKLLRDREGVIHKEAVYGEVWRAFSHTFGPSDMRKLKGRSERKWQNNVAWALAVGTRQGKWKSRDGILVLLDPTVTDGDWIEWVLQGKNKRASFRKQCNRCKTMQPLGNMICVACGKPFPKPNNKVNRKPLGEA